MGQAIDWAARRIDSGEWAGWSVYDGRDPFEDLAGPFFWRRDEDGAIRCAFRVERRHLNAAGVAHGGSLMAFADFTLFEFARDALGPLAVTTAFNTEFVSPVRDGDLVEGSGDVIRAGRSLVFVRGLLQVRGETVMSFSAVAKKLSAGAG